MAKSDPTSTEPPSETGDTRAPGPPTHLTVAELAGLAGVSGQTIRRFFKDPTLLGTRMRTRVAAVLREIGLAGPQLEREASQASEPALESEQAAAPEREREREPEPEPEPEPCEVPAHAAVKDDAAHTSDAPPSRPPLPEPEAPSPRLPAEDPATDILSATGGMADDGRLTINDIARLASVSTKTVSRYLNDSPLLSDTMRARVRRVIEETGFVPNAQARALALRRNFLLALIHTGDERARVEQVEDGMLAAMAGGEFALLIQPLQGPAGRHPAQLHTFLTRHNPSGVVLLPPLAQDDMIVEACRHAGTPCIRLGPTPDGAGLCSADRAAMAQAVAWLVALGHDRIGLVGGPEGARLAQARELGYLDAMADHGLDRGAALIEPGDNSFASGLAAGRVLLEVSPRPSAIIACNDAMAAGILHAATEARITVPDELSVIGFDDTPLAQMTCPPLTSMQIPWAALGHEAVRRLQANPREIADDAAPPHFGARLIERGSVAPRKGTQEDGRTSLSTT
ncbi:LacI family DNA-binding transcriptional regulator [Novosphingobium sp. BW1]|uniref:LacI family DNA-binding transcriptional regulator n=1 Tax=Novosphingobium sp. BW1 TaxID=2592621 RepID=UPI0013967B3D|nr:LacI family DNA-binding transcriptional regulator [Novosphingobium sp. BW1]